MRTLDEQIEKNKKDRFARMQRFRKTHREHINVLPKAMRHELLRKLKTPITLVVIFFLARTCFSQGDTSAWLPNYIAAVVEAERTADSLQHNTLTLLPFQKELTHIAKQYGISPPLFAAIIQKESVFNQWASRVELHYKKKQVVIREAKAWSRKHGGIPTFHTELDDRSRSYGLGQLMGQGAREQGFDSLFLSALYEPEINLNECAKKIRTLFRKYGTDTISVISAYNQGNNRKKNGVLENIDYVDDVGQYWKRYIKVFRRIEIYEYQKSFNRVRDSLLVRFSPGQLTLMFGVPRERDSIGIAEPVRIITSDTTQRQREDRRGDTTAKFINQGKGKQNSAVFVSEYKPRYIKSEITNFLLVVFGLASVLGLGWFFLERTRQHANLSRYDQRVPRSLDRATKRLLRNELKATRKGRALHRMGHLIANTRSNTHG